MDADHKCPIWGTPAERLDAAGDRETFMSERAGGGFSISRPAIAELAGDVAGWKKIALSDLVFSSSRQGIEPYIDTQLLGRLKRLPPLQAQKKLDRFLLALSDEHPIFGECFASREFFSSSNADYLLAAINSPEIKSAAAYREAQLLWDTLHAEGLLEGTNSDPRCDTRISIEGWKQIEALGLAMSASDQIFVAMWFGSDEQTTLYSQGIKPAIESAGYIAVRIDDTEHNEKIDDQIISEIRKSKAVVVDMTCGLATPVGGWAKSEKVGAPRGGVFFEAGFAAGLKLPVIWTIKEDIAEIENVVHFDVRQYNQLRWNDDLSEFSERLRYRIEATLGRGNAQQQT